MLKKISLIFAVLILFCSLAFVLYYNKIENSYDLHLLIRQQQILAGLKKINSNQVCTDISTRSDCFATQIKILGGFKFNSDFAVVLPSVFKSCKNELNCVYQTIDKLVALIQLENLELIKSGNKNSSEFTKLLHLEQKYFLNILKNLRKKLVNEWNNPITTANQKITFTTFIKNIDSKILEVKKFTD